MISRLPRWIWIGASALAFIAGMINAIGFLGFRHQGVTHLTGTTTLLGIAIGKTDARMSLELLGLALAFLVGATLSGFIIQESTLRLGRRYGVALLIESILLFCAVPLLLEKNVAGDYLASTACGLQNAMMSAYSGAVLRTTHVSGIFTDIGIFFGHCLRGLPVDWRRLKLWSSILLSFMLGGSMGAILFRWFNYRTLYFPATLTGLVGISYGIYRQRQMGQQSISTEKSQ
jgi:uncharacterized membrane protein YoaK (UPF0700 family)